MIEDEKIAGGVRRTPEERPPDATDGGRPRIPDTARKQRKIIIAKKAGH